MSDPQPTAAPPTPPVLPLGWRANPVIVRLTSLHFWLGFAALVVGILKLKPQLAEYKEALDYLFDALVPGSIFAASIYRPPVDQAKIAHVDNVGYQTPTTSDPPALPPAVPLLALLLPLCLTLSGCTLAQAITGSYKGLTLAETTVATAIKQFPPAARTHRLELVNKATSEAQGQAALDAWDVTEGRISKAILGTDATVKLCRDAIAEISKGVRDKSQLAGWIATGIRLGIDIKDLLAAAGVPLGGL